MQCKKCGREVLDEDIFCTFCGTRQVQEENTSEKKNMSISLSDGQLTINKEALLGWVMKIGFFLLVCALYIVKNWCFLETVFAGVFCFILRHVPFYYSINTVWQVFA